MDVEDREMHDLQLESNDERTGVMRGDVPAATRNTRMPRKAWLPGVCLILVGVIVIVTVFASGAATSSPSSASAKGGWPHYPELTSPGRFNPTAIRDDFATVGANFGLYSEANEMSDQGGYGMRVGISADGRRIAASLPPATVRILSFNPNTNLWDQETVIKTPNVAADQEHDGLPHHDMVLAKGGERVIFSHYDQVSVYFRTDFPSVDWNPIGQQVLPSRSSINNVTQTRDHFGSQLAITDDGSLIAVLDEASNRERVKVFWDERTMEQDTEIDEWSSTYEMNVCAHCGTDPRLGNRMDPGDIAMSGDGSIVAIANLGSNKNTGEVALYQYDPLTQTDLKLRSFPGRPGNHQEYGTIVKVSSDGSTVAISPRVGGFVDVFRRVGDAWKPLGQRLGLEHGPKFAADTNFGASVAMSRDGYVIAVGGSGNLNPDDNTPERFQHGYVIVYQYDPASEPNPWRPLGAVTSGELGDGFGSQVDIALDGSRIIVGAPFRLWKTNNIGGVHVYQIPLVDIAY